MSDPVKSLVPDGRTKKLFPKDWLEIVNLAETGVKVHKIAEIYGVHATVIYRGLQKRKVNLTAISARITAEEAEKAQSIMLDRIRETRDKDYKFTEFLQQQIVAVVVSAQKAGEALGKHLDTIKALKIALDGVRGGTDNKWRILGLDKENENADAALPELPIRALTDVETEALRSAQEVEDGGIGDEAALVEIEAELAEAPVIAEDEE